MKTQPILAVSRCLGLFPFDDLGCFNSCLSYYSLAVSVLVIFCHGWKLVLEMIDLSSSVSVGFLSSAISVIIFLTNMTGTIVHFDVMLRSKNKFAFLTVLNQHLTPYSDLHFLCYGIMSIIISEILLKINMEVLTVKFITAVLTDFCLVFPLVILLQYLSILNKLRINFSCIKNSTNVDRHEYLVLLSSHINSLYGRQILVFLVTWLINLIVTAYELVYSFHNRPSNPNMNGYLCLSNGLFIVFYMAELLYLCGTCTSTVSECFDMKGHEILTLSRWLGFFPFDEQGDFEVGSALCGFCLYLFVVFVQTLKFVRNIIQTNAYKTNSLASSIVFLLYACSVLCPAVHFNVMVKNRKKFHFMAKLSDETTQNAFSTMSLLYFGIAAKILSEILEIFIVTSSGTEYTLGLVSNVCSLVGFLITLQYSSIVKLLKANFRLIKNTTNVDRHENLVVLGMNINSLYGRQLLVFLIELLVNLTAECYKVIYTIYVTSKGKELVPHAYWVLCLRLALLMLFLSAELFCICETCSSTCSEAEAFNHELFRMMRSNDRLCNNKKLHLYVTMKQTVEFTACGFFKLGNPLVTSIIAAATTYLVILIQFSFPKASTST